MEPQMLQNREPAGEATWPCGQMSVLSIAGSGIAAAGVAWDAGLSMEPHTLQKCEPAAPGPWPCGQRSGRAALFMGLPFPVTP